MLVSKVRTWATKKKKSILKLIIAHSFSIGEHRRTCFSTPYVKYKTKRPAVGAAKDQGNQFKSQNATTKADVTVAAIHDNPASTSDALVYEASSSYERQMSFSGPVKRDSCPIISIFEALGSTCPNDAKKEMKFTLMPNVWKTKDVKTTQMHKVGKELSRYVSSPTEKPVIKVQATTKNRRVFCPYLDRLRARNGSAVQGKAGNSAIRILKG